MSKREARVIKRDAKEPKGAKREPNGAKRGAKGEPKGDQHASRNLPSEKILKRVPKGRARL